MKKRKSLHKKKTSSRKLASKKSIRNFTTVVILSFALLIAAANIPVTKALTNNTSQNVLGEKEEKKEENKGSENKNEESKKAEEQQREEQKKTEEARVEAEKNSGSRNSTQTIQPTTNNFTPFKVKTKTEAIISNYQIQTKTEGNKRETEIEGINGQKIKTKVEDDGTAKVEIEDRGLKLKYVVENGQTKLKVENESGEERSATEDEIKDLQKEIEQELENEDINIATGEGKIKLRRKNVTAESHFPLSINMATKQLVVTTPNGQKTVTVLPDQAVENLLATGVVSKIEGQSSSSANLEPDIKLEVKNNEAVYKVKGIKNKKLFGFIPVSTPVTAFVSAESGIPVSTEQSLLSNIIDSLSR